MENNIVVCSFSIQIPPCKGKEMKEDFTDGFKAGWSLKQSSITVLDDQKVAVRLHDIYHITQLFLLCCIVVNVGL